MYGIYINGKRPATKKQVKEADANNVNLEATSIFGDEYAGTLADAPDGVYTFVGPDPYSDRKFYGNITVRNGKVKVA